MFISVHLPTVLIYPNCQTDLLNAIFFFLSMLFPFACQVSHNEKHTLLFNYVFLRNEYPSAEILREPLF